MYRNVSPWGFLAVYVCIGEFPQNYGNWCMKYRWLIRWVNYNNSINEGNVWWLTYIGVFFRNLILNCFIGMYTIFGFFCLCIILYVYGNQVFLVKQLRLQKNFLVLTEADKNSAFFQCCPQVAFERSWELIVSSFSEWDHFIEVFLK